MKPPQQQHNSLPNRHSSLNSSPVSKLLANRPSAVQSFVSKIDAISFLEGPSNHQQLHLQQQPHQALCSPKHSPPRDLLHHSPPLNDPIPRLDEFCRDTPTIRQLKTSLRSRLKTDSDRNQRLSEDSGKSGSSYSHHRNPNDSPKRCNSHSFSPRQPSITALSITSVLSSSSRSAPASSSANRSSDILPAFTPLNTPFHLSSIISSGDSRSSLSTSPSPTVHDQQKNQSTNNANASVSESCHAENVGIILSPLPALAQSALHANHSEALIDLPEMRIPLTNLHLSPPSLAIWSLKAYERDPTHEILDLATHLVILPLHTVLAITRKLPILRRCLDSTPLSHQAEKENQGILITATQLAFGLMLASGWKVAKKLINSS